VQQWALTLTLLVDGFGRIQHRARDVYRLTSMDPSGRGFRGTDRHADGAK
jgi:hypothetical protein